MIKKIHLDKTAIIYFLLIVNVWYGHTQINDGMLNPQENLAPYSFDPPPSFRSMTNKNTSVARDGIFVRDGDFELFGLSEAATCDISNNCNSTSARASLQEDCVVTKWKVSHGTPEICVDGDGNHSIHLWSGDWFGDGDSEGEGIFYDCPLSSLKTYEISMKLSSSGPIDHIYFYLVNDPVHKELDGTQYSYVEDNPFYEVPSFGECTELLYTIDNFNSSDPQPFTIPVFSPDPTLAGEGAKLWIYAEDDDVGATLLFIDDVTDGVFGSPQVCEGTSSFNGNISSRTELAYNITAQGSAIVSSVSNVSFIAGNSITLGPDFHAQYGAAFSAKISECPMNNNCPGSVFPCSDIARKVGTTLSMDAVHELDEINEENKNGIIAFPNPTTGLFALSYYVDQNDETSAINVYNASGIEVLSIQSSSERASQVFEQQIDLGGLPSGIYFLRYKSESTVKIIKILKQD